MAVRSRVFWAASSSAATSTTTDSPPVAAGYTWIIKWGLLYNGGTTAQTVTVSIFGGVVYQGSLAAGQSVNLAGLYVVGVPGNFARIVAPVGSDVRFRLHGVRLEGVAV